MQIHSSISSQRSFVRGWRRLMPLLLLPPLLFLAGCEDATTAEDYVGVQKTEPHDPSQPPQVFAAGEE